ncbi:MAG: hypothetical protein FWB91_12755, partial [Defluviitaleaceae bacterium]|nr:hypothetical protein [Defluviitaleaceae bacterium]
MIFNWGGTNDGGNGFRPFGQIDFANDSRRDINRSLREMTNHRIFEAHERVRQQRQQEQRRRPSRPRTGSARLSNTDGISRAQQIRARLVSKLKEVVASEMEPRARDALAADIQMQIDRVDQMINAIRRREQAIQAERSRRRDESDQERRRRQFDMQERRIYIRNELLYHADEGGLNPNAPPFSMGSGFNSAAPVAVDIGGMVGSFDMPMPSGGGAEV